MKKTLFLLPIAILALAGCNGNGGGTNPEPTPGPTPTPTPTPTKSSMQIAYEAAEALEKDATSTESYTFTGVVTALQGKNAFFVQDGDYALEVYATNIVTSAGVSVGKAVSVTSTLKNYNNTLETSDAPTVTVTGDGTLPTAVEVTSYSQLTELKQNVLVNVSFKLSEAVNGWASSTSKNPKGYIMNGTEAGTDQTVLSLPKASFTTENGAVANGSAANDVIRAVGAVSGQYKAASAGGVNQILVQSSTVLSK